MRTEPLAPSIPTLDDVANDPARAAMLPPVARAALLGRCAAVLAALSAASFTAAPPSEPITPAGKVWLTVPEVAERLSLAPSYVYELARRGDLPSVRRGKYVRIPADGLAQWSARLALPLTSARYAAYHPHHERRRASQDPKAVGADTASLRRARRRDP